MKKGTVIGMAKLFSVVTEMFIISCGECGMIFHMEALKPKTTCPICNKEIFLTEKEE
jgi:predicted Zn-ribbon and HTH transcriptional regulator